MELIAILAAAFVVCALVSRALAGPPRKEPLTDTEEQDWQAW